ncbi:MAG TPA: GGDEF domain-containing protein [Terracidiphilus sp.]|jgi:diguanylate cyclase (GGDEF)-like protein|nr:GGDEF domain-containing protein [Terracidiphilus sp.]
MISIRKYLDGGLAEPEPATPQPRNRRGAGDLLPLAMEAYRAALSEMGRCSVDACAATGTALEKVLVGAADGLALNVTADALAQTGASARQQLREWGRDTARHYQQKAGEVKEMLLAMAQTAESVGERDQRCARQMHDVTAQLRQIASLEDLTQMRSSIEKSAADLKSSIDRMTAEGKAVLDALQAKVTTFQVKLEEAEQTASCDALTRLHSRLCVENQLEQRIAAAVPFCVAILDINGFKAVNDTHGHLVGAEVLKQFATELRSACRSSDLVGRWGGDEFIVLLDCGMAQAQAQIERVSRWVCGNYVVEGIAGALKLSVEASIGLAEFAPLETLKQLLDRADAAMYRKKPAGRGETTDAGEREIARSAAR